MIRELDTAVLAHDLEAYGLTRGDVGAVVHCYKDGMTFVYARGIAKAGNSPLRALARERA